MTRRDSPRRICPASSSCAWDRHPSAIVCWMRSTAHCHPQPLPIPYGTLKAAPLVFGPHPQGLPQPEMSVGYPHPKVQVRLIGEDGNPADTGVLEMKCPAIMTGYHNRPDIAPPIP